MPTVYVRNAFAPVFDDVGSFKYEGRNTFDATTLAAATAKARAWMRRDLDAVAPERIRVTKGVVPGATFIDIMPVGWKPPPR